MSRTALRTAAVLGATAALTFAGAGVAAATTATTETDGNDVSVTFELEDGQGGDACGAALVPPLAAAGLATTIAAAVADSDPNPLNLLPFISDVFSAIEDTDGVVALKKGFVPAVTLSRLDDSNTVSATDVPSNLYVLVTICASELLDDDFAPNITPVFVGGPVEAIMGSVGGLSSGEGGGLDTLSSVIGGGEEDGGVGALLSSTLGGDNEGGFLDGISSNGDDE